MDHDLSGSVRSHSAGLDLERLTLPKRLGVISLVFIIVAFNAPLAVMAGFAQLAIGFGNGVGAPLSFGLAGLILLTFSAGFVSMSRFIDKPGAFYQYIVAGFGRPLGLAGAFLATSAYILMSAGSYLYMGLIAVESTTRIFGSSIFGWQLWSLFFIILVTGIGLFRVDLSIRLLGKLVALEVVLVAIWEVAVLFRGGPEGYAASSFTVAGFTSGSVGVGVLFAMLCMVGIEAGACFSAETKNPEIAVGRATVISIVFMTLFYGLGTWLYIVTQGTSKVVANAATNPVGSFFSSVQHYLGMSFLNLFSFTLVTSQMAATNAVQGSASRYLFALGRDRVLPLTLARVHPKLQSPYIAVMMVAFVSLITLALTVLFGLDPVTAYAALTGMGIYFLIPLLIATSCAVIAFYQRHRELPAGAWPRLIAPALSAAALLGLFVLTSINLKVLVVTRANMLVSILAVGLVPSFGWLLALFYRRYNPAVYILIGDQ